MFIFPNTTIHDTDDIVNNILIVLETKDYTEDKSYDCITLYKIRKKHITHVPVSACSRMIITI